MISISLDIALSYNTIENEELETSRTYAIDWDEGRIIGYVDEIEAVKQFIKKALITPRFKCLIYDSQYGNEIRDSIIAQSVTREYIEAELPFLIEDTIIHDKRILKVYNIDFEFKDTFPLQDTVIISFDVNTIYGELSMKEEI